MQYAGYVPASRAGTFRTTVVPGSMSSVSYVVPAASTANVCGAWPMFITENSMGWPTGTAMAEGSIAELAEHDLNRRRAGRSLFRRSTASGTPAARRAYQRDGTCNAQRPPSPDRSHHRALLVCVGIGHVASSIRSSASRSLGRGSRARRDQRHRRIVDPAGTIHACSRAISSSFRSNPRGRALADG